MLPKADTSSVILNGEDRRLAITRFGDYLNISLALDELANPFTNYGMIIRQDHPDWRTFLQLPTSPSSDLMISTYLILYRYTKNRGRSTTPRPVQTESP